MICEVDSKVRIRFLPSDPSSRGAFLYRSATGEFLLCLRNNAGLYNHLNSRKSVFLELGWAHKWQNENEIRVEKQVIKLKHVRVMINFQEFYELKFSFYF